MQIPQLRQRPRLSDRDLLNLCREYRYAHTQYQLSQCCGRNRSWISSLAASGRRMSVDGLTRLALNITRYANQHPDLEAQTQLMELRHLVLHECMHRRHENAQAWIARRNQGMFDAHS